MSRLIYFSRIQSTLKPVAFFLLFLVVSIQTPSEALADSASTTDLSGVWRFRLDPDKVGHQQNWQDTKLNKTIRLPGTTDLAGHGCKTEGPDDGRMSRVYEYIGPAWYQRDFNVPETWKGKRITLSLERCKWKTTIWIDGRRVGSEDGLSTPHVYTLSQLEPGPHTLTIEIDNSQIHTIGVWGHSYTEETQSIWNGAVGKISLTATDPVWIEAVRVFPSKAADRARLEITMGNQTGNLVVSKVTGKIVDSKGQVVATGNMTKKIDGKTATFDLVLPILNDEKITRWNEFSPVLYSVDVSLDAGGKFSDRRKETFGFRQIGHNGSYVTINKRPTFLRGTIDCATYPLTGHPPMDVDSWMRVFRTIKSHGMNHVRYHSWCPPEAAFTAADRLGVYLQVETPIWIDGWMCDRGHRMMKNQKPPFVKLLGKDSAVVDYVKRELQRLLDTYGNHPSFCMLAIGNEIDSRSDYDALAKMISDAKKHDPRHLYSISAARKLTWADDFYVSHVTPGGKATRGLRGPRNDWDFAPAIRDMRKHDVPLIAHEIGQWPVYPDYDEIKKYTGPLRPRTIEGFRDKAASRGLTRLSKDFQQASGRFACLLYKAEMEAMLRTRDYGGFQLLQLNDFPGQKEALVGILDSFWDSKGIISPVAFREFCCETVPLVRFEKYIWTNDETFTAKAQVHYFGVGPLKSATCRWSIARDDGKTVAEGVLPKTNLTDGKLSDIGEISVPLSSVADARRLEVLLEIKNTKFRNRWNVWVFPADEKNDSESSSPDNKVLVADRFDKATKKALADGKPVLLIPLHISSRYSAPGRFMPSFWSAGWFPAGGSQTLGIICDPSHPALAGFPTDSHSDWQWHGLVSRSKVFVLNDVPADQYTPIIRSISDFHQNNHLVPLFETRAGPGRLLVCGFDLNGNLRNRPAARKLLACLRRYAASDEFSPSTKMPMEHLEKMFLVPPPAKTLKTASAGPQEIKNIESAVLDVQAAQNVPTKNHPHQWKTEYDRVNIKKSGFDYRPRNVVAWKDNSGAAWAGMDLGLHIKCPVGFHGKCYIHFYDWNRQNRGMTGEFESHRFSLAKHDKGTWTVFNVIREDSLDGKLNLSTKLTSGPNVMITRVVLVPVVQ